jgi:predicted O-methyltransferase YrrM
MGTRASATTLAPELWPEELAAVVELARIANRGKPYLEIGTAAGGTLCQMMKCFSDANRPRFVVVDSMRYFPDQLEIVRKNLRQHGLDTAGVDLRVATSDDAFAAAEKAGERYDFMFIDASHKIRCVTRDLRWLRLLAVGGIACLHDYGKAHKGVMWPADRFLKKYPTYQREKLAGRLLALRKTAAATGAEITAGDAVWATLLAPVLQLEASVSKRLRKQR